MILTTHISSSVQATFFPIETITNFMCSFFVIFCYWQFIQSNCGCFKGRISFISLLELSYLLMLQSALSANFQHSVCVGPNFKEAVVCNPTTFQISRHQPAFLEMIQDKLNKSKDGSRNPATLKKDPFAKAVNEKLKILLSCLKALILNVAKVLSPPLKLGNHNF